MITFIRKLKDWETEAILVKREGGEYFIVSDTTPEDNPIVRSRECLVFPAHASGKVKTMIEVLGSRTFADALQGLIDGEDRTE